MTIKQIIEQIEQKQSLLCVGLDPVLERLPAPVANSDKPLFNFGKEIVDATHKYVIAFKLNTAFYEAYGYRGWQQLEELAAYIKTHYPQIFLIADAKRGDVLHASQMYARAFFEQMPFDAVTVNPYLGKDVVLPFLKYEGKWVIILGLSSNPSAWDLQLIQEIETRDYVFEKVFKYGSWWGDENKVMFVAGALMAYKLQQIRHIVPKHFLLVPGISAPGASLEDVLTFGLNDDYGMIITISRSIIYSSQNDDFAFKAAEKAHQYQKAIELNLKKIKQRKL